VKEWYQQLDLRERRMLITGGLLALVLLPYLLFWLPLEDDLRNLQKGLKIERASIVWMRTAADEVLSQRRVPASVKNKTATSGRSMLSIVDKSTRTAGLGDSVKRVEPDGKDAVKVWLEAVDFDLLMKWMVTMDDNYQMTANIVTLERKNNKGLVDARIVLQGAI